jgi:hypothetical protein
MREEELQELAFRAAKGACDLLYSGIVNRFLAQFEEDLRLIIKEIDYIKAYIQNRDEKKETKTFPFTQNNEKLKEIYEKLDKENLIKSLEEAMKVNTLRTIPLPKVEVPEFKKGADEE